MDESLTEREALCPNCHRWKGVMVRYMKTVEEAVEFCDFNEDGEPKMFQSVPNTGPKETETLGFHCQMCGADFDEPNPGDPINQGENDE